MNNSLKSFEFWAVVEMSFKRFLIWSSVALLCIYAIFKEGIMGNIHVKLYEIWTRGSGGDVP